VDYWGYISRELITDPEITSRLLKEFIADEVKNTGFQRVVICLSGGDPLNNYPYS